MFISRIVVLPEAVLNINVCNNLVCYEIVLFVKTCLGC